MCRNLIYVHIHIFTLLTSFGISPTKTAVHIGLFGCRSLPDSISKVLVHLFFLFYNILHYFSLGSVDLWVIIAKSDHYSWDLVITVLLVGRQTTKWQERSATACGFLVEACRDGLIYCHSNLKSYNHMYVKITASFRYHSLLVLKYVPDQLPCQIRTTCKCYLVCTWKTQAPAVGNSLCYSGCYW